MPTVDGSSTPGCRTFNLYGAPTIKPKPGDASPWIKHVASMFGAEAEHIINWLAHRVQHPEEKINHALVLGGAQGIGKDTLLEPIKAAIGPWNFTEVSPVQMLGRVQRICEICCHAKSAKARDLGETDRYAFYEHLKTLTAAPPNILRRRQKAHPRTCRLKCVQHHHHHKQQKLDAPAERRSPPFRRLVTAQKGRFPSGLLERALPLVCQWRKRDSSRIISTGSTWLASMQRHRRQRHRRFGKSSIRPARRKMLKWPTHSTRSAGLPRSPWADPDKGGFSAPGFADWLRDRKNRRKIPHRFEEAGYVPVRNPDATDGLWKVTGKRQAVYAKRDLSLRDQIEAAARVGTPTIPSRRPFNRSVWSV